MGHSPVVVSRWQCPCLDMFLLGGPEPRVLTSSSCVRSENGVGVGGRGKGEIVP